MRLFSFISLVSFSALAACASSPAPPPVSATAAPDASPAPAQAAAAAPASDRVDGAAAHKLVQDGAVLVDVRSPDEYVARHIDGAVNVPAEQVAAHDFGAKDKPVVLYCSHGNRSAQAGKVLREQGYTRVYVLGAMSAWGP